MNIAVVDDTEIVGKLISSVVGRLAGTPPQYFKSANTFLEYARTNRVGLAVIDCELGPDWGPDVAVELLRLNPEAKVILTSGGVCVREVAGEPVPFVPKPFKLTEWQSALERCGVLSA